MLLAVWTKTLVKDFFFHSSMSEFEVFMVSYLITFVCFLPE